MSGKLQNNSVIGAMLITINRVIVRIIAERNSRLMFQILRIGTICSF